MTNPLHGVTGVITPRINTQQVPLHERSEALDVCCERTRRQDRRNNVREFELTVRRCHAANMKRRPWSERGALVRCLGPDRLVFPSMTVLNGSSLRITGNNDLQMLKHLDREAAGWFALPKLVPATISLRPTTVSLRLILSSQGGRG